MGQMFDDIVSASRDRPDANRPRCHTCRLLESLDNGDRRDLISALSDASIDGTVIAKYLTDKLKTRISDSSINRHRRHHSGPEWD